MSAQTANVLRHVGKRAGVSGDIRAGAIHRNPGHHGTFDRTLIFYGRTLIGERVPLVASSGGSTIFRTQAVAILTSCFEGGGQQEPYDH